MNDIFTAEYIQNILNPFVGKPLKMKIFSNGIDMPFCLETSIDSPIQIILQPAGIQFVLKNNHTINTKLKEALRKSLINVEIYPYKLDSLTTGKTDVFDKIVEDINNSTIIQIAFTYYNMIKTISVSPYSFSINNTTWVFL